MQTQGTATFAREVPRSTLSCPQCGSFFDEPRVNPLTGELSRKCAACLEWYPLAPPRWEGSE
jgi:hypothetical protein